MTVAELRRKDVLRLSEILGDYETAKHIMNCFYVISNREQRLLVMENDYETYTRRHSYIEQENAKQIKAVNKLDKLLKPAGYEVMLSGGYAQIVRRDDTKTGCISEVFTYGYYYN